MCAADENGRAVVPGNATSCMGGMPAQCTGWGINMTYARSANVVPSAPANTFTCDRWADSPKRIVFIHVGKTGGDTMQQTIQLVNLNVTVIHTFNAQQALEDFDIYLVSSRSPVGRTASSWNWMHGDGGGMWDPINLRGRDSTVARTKEANANAEEVNATMKALDDALGATLVPVAYNGGFIDKVSECFPQLPGAFDAFAVALSGEGPCSDLARRCMHEPNAGCGHIAFGLGFYLSQVHRGSFVTLADKMRASGKRVSHTTGTMSPLAPSPGPLTACPPVGPASVNVSRSSTWQRRTSTPTSRLCGSGFAWTSRRRPSVSMRRLSSSVLTRGMPTLR